MGHKSHQPMYWELKPGTAEYRKAYDREAKRRRVHPYMAMTWYPEATKVELENAGSMFPTPWRGVLHTTEGSSAQGAIDAYRRNRSAPHFTVTFEGGVFKVYQHIPLDKAARALRNVAGGVETNRTRCIQIEIVGSASKSASFPSQYLDGLGKLMRWIEGNTEIKPVGPGKPFNSAYGQNNRFTPAQWNSFNGWCGHCHVPENDHWDPGQINLTYLLAHDSGVKPMFDPAIPVAAMRKDPYGGVIAVGPDGAIYNAEGSLYFGGPNGQPYWGSRKAADIEFGIKYPAGTQWGNYRYIVVSTQGERYGYGTRVEI